MDEPPPQFLVMTNVTEYQPKTPTTREVTIGGHPARDVTATFTMNDPAP